MDKKKLIATKMKIRSQKWANDQDHKLRDLADDPEFLNDILVIGRKIAEEYDKVWKDGSFDGQDDFWKDYSEFEYECYRFPVNKNNKQQVQKQFEEQQESEQAENIAVPESSITLNDLIEKLIQFKVKKGKWKERSAKSNSEMLYVIRDFLEYAIEMKNPMIHLFETVNAIQFEDEFCHYPSNCKKNSRKKYSRNNGND